MSDATQKLKPVVSAEEDKDAGKVTFSYQGPYPIGVGWAITKNGHTTHKEATLVPGETDTFSTLEGVEKVTCTWGYGAPITVHLSQAAAAS